MIKKTLTVITAIILLTGCSGGGSNDGSNGSTTGLLLYETEQFSINFPQDWEVMERSEFTSNIPAESVVAFRNNIKNEVFTANVNISVASIPDNFGAEDMAKSSKASAKETLVSYEELSTKETSVNIGDKTIQGYLVDYQGKRSATESIIHFTQLYVVTSGLGYTVTAGYLPNEDEAVVKTIEGMLDSFALK